MKNTLQHACNKIVKAIKAIFYSIVVILVCLFIISIFL